MLWRLGGRMTPADEHRERRPHSGLLRTTPANAAKSRRCGEWRRIFRAGPMPPVRRAATCGSCAPTLGRPTAGGVRTTRQGAAVRRFWWVRGVVVLGLASALLVPAGV